MTHSLAGALLLPRESLGKLLALLPRGLHVLLAWVLRMLLPWILSALLPRLDLSRLFWMLSGLL